MIMMKSLCRLSAALIVASGLALPLKGADTAAGIRARRLEFRTKLERADMRHAALQAGLKDTDAVIRSRALLFMVQEQGADNAWTVMQDMAGDGDPQVLDVLVSCGLKLSDPLKRQELMRKIAASSVACRARYRASKASFGFYRENKRLKDSGSFDHEIIIASSFAIPEDKWLFKTDPKTAGHRTGWYAPNLDETDWKAIRMGAWEGQGFENYDGIGWYRIRFKMPEKMKHEAVELHFNAVDEGAWVWLNGTYIGQHDEGPDGWTIPFWLDVTQEIKWGQENILVVRVEDSSAAGGIWKPVNVEILKSGDN